MGLEIVNPPALVSPVALDVSTETTDSSMIQYIYQCTGAVTYLETVLFLVQLPENFMQSQRLAAGHQGPSSSFLPHTAAERQGENARVLVWAMGLLRTNSLEKKVLGELKRLSCWVRNLLPSFLVSPTLHDSARENRQHMTL